MPARPVFRLARAVVFATVCVVLAAVGHMAAGRPVAPGSAGVGLAIVAGVTVLLAGQERSFPTIVGGLLGGQFVLHALFAQAGGGGHHHAPEVLTHPGGGRPAMTLAHVSAALLTAWWLRRGEAVLWTLARRIAAAVVRPLALPGAPHPASPRLSVPPEDPPLRRLLAPLRHVVILRGPPAELSAPYI
ncbi:MFS transporter [Actinomadura alba]|uniref:MFS transporter n=1 Tax=Actinomadura alba TaxID=406431 RepID=A0ABR7LNN1_9ACTN|nr:MFS transporter [Actinomadura alba]MBC6466459.1 MFS transporter [Actinomadura alba]